METVTERIQRLREKMAEHQMDAYLVPTSDFHESEYVGEYFACRKYITGFTGSAGQAVITKDWVGLWTDGRYFVQASAELAGSGVELMKMGEPGVPTVETYLQQHLPEGGVLGFDGRVINSMMGERLRDLLGANRVSVESGYDLVGEIWEDRPELSSEPIWVLDEKYAGKSAKEKIADLRAQMERAGADTHILTTLDDIAWLLNIRGNDIPCNPVVLSYLAVTKTDLILFIDAKAVSDEVREYLSAQGVKTQPYDAIYEYVRQIHYARVLLEKAKANDAILNGLDDTNKVIDQMNPTVMAKAVKNPTEIENMKKAHILDGVAMTKFIYWLKKNVGKIPMTEYSVSDYLEELRKEQGALDLSFTTISAYGANAAMCHYHALPETCVDLHPEGLYLVDSGGQYLEGTTDITRTVALGPVTEEAKKHYTLVLISMLRLAHTTFIQGASGMTIDYVAREPFWKEGLDFNHGTGHGVGYLLNVHERPVGIRSRVAAGRRPEVVPFMPGMVCSDEPGLYIEGKHGIRTENLMYCLKKNKTDFGQFLGFEYLTWVPIDLEPVEVSMMTDEDLGFLNEYHQTVYEKISPYLSGDELEWLHQVTRPLKKNA